MGVEPTGLQDILSRIAEISSRFGPTAAPTPHKSDSPQRWEPSKSTGLPGMPGSSPLSGMPGSSPMSGLPGSSPLSGLPGSSALFGSPSSARSRGMAYGLPPDPDDPSGEASTQSFNFESVLAQAAKKSGMDPRLLAAVVRVESGGDPRSQSNKGAMGLMQLMPETARDYGVKNPYDPLQNMTGGGKYLKNMIGMFGGDLALGLAAYNAGEGAVARHKGIPPYKETKAFVRRVMDIYNSNQP